MTDIASIARGLTKAQRECIPHIPDKPYRMPQRWLSLVGYDFEKMGLMRRSMILDKSCITPLGQAVRAYLMENTQ